MLVFGMTACGSSNDSEAVNNFDAEIDVEYAKDVVQTISSFGDDPVMGMRSAGSPAEKQAIDYLKEQMEEIGLQNVTVDETTVDGWTFNGADITFTNADGEEQKIDLCGYQTTLVAENEQVELVYLNEGTAADYEGIDVTGKLVLIDIDQNENWWISYPAYQAKVKGAKGVITHSIFAGKGEDRVGVQDICGPADAPALAISNKDKKALVAVIKANDGEPITVTLNCDSQVTKNATSHNVWGEIPGKTDETIFVFAHVDGYFHSQYDDAQGVSVSMAIAKALIDSGYEPDKTIRFCFHGSEEWGVSGSEYDWSAGAYEEITALHPEWVEGGFAIVNNDGGYSVEGETYAGVNSAVELQDFVKESIGENAEYHMDVKDEEIFVCAAACLGMYLALEAIIDDGDEVIMQAPYFTPYPQQVELARGVPVELPTYEEEDFQINIKRLESLITDKTKALIINSPSNPTGNCLTVETMDKIAEIAEKHDLVVISDDIYTAFSYQNQFVPFASLQGMKERTIVLNSFSKNFTMTGWRVGNIIAPQEIIEVIRQINENVVFTAPSVSQRAAIYALRHRHEIQPDMIAEYKKRMFYAAERINGIPKMSVIYPPKGSFYLFINIKETGLTSEETAELILKEAHVLTLPGNAFGTCGEGYIRIACTVNIDILKEAFDRIANIPLLG